MIFIKDNLGNNVLQKAIKNGNTRCVKLILDKLSSVSMNNIHAVKANFGDLLDYNGFEEYLRLLPHFLMLSSIVTFKITPNQ
ncbi:UNKNOWN [Stylonychia lemnae]|uniref:Ankyrin repeat protein n=1 Tax=Stylonychia lemnae TaxID=5949 RepID=A0A077ZSF5_STYLE|nr:UNKNOWN [Stylonychia lemnae]|eukprot:CDW72295.1 UNKNOWN [Stylonychia lemnae]